MVSVFFVSNPIANKLATAPWHVEDLVDDLDDQEYYQEDTDDGLMIVDECFPLKKMRVRSEDVSYMTTSWKNAIRAKRRATVKYYKDKSAHTWEVKQSCQRVFNISRYPSKILIHRCVTHLINPHQVLSGL